MNPRKETPYQSVPGPQKAILTLSETCLICEALRDRMNRAGGGNSQSVGNIAYEEGG